MNNDLHQNNEHSLQQQENQTELPRITKQDIFGAMANSLKPEDKALLDHIRKAKAQEQDK